jgi:hypothetical protein
MKQNEYKSQSKKIAVALRCHAPNWIEMPDLWRVSGAFAVHSRIADLRRSGMNIENKREVKGRIVHSFYRLVG